MHIIALRIKLQRSRRQPFLKEHGTNSSISLHVGSWWFQCMQSPRDGKLEAVNYSIVPLLEKLFPYKTFLIRSKGWFMKTSLPCEKINAILFPLFSHGINGDVNLKRCNHITGTQILHIFCLLLLTKSMFSDHLKYILLKFFKFSSSLNSFISFSSAMLIERPLCHCLIFKITTIK